MESQLSRRNPHETIRMLLRTECGMSKEEVQKLSNSQAQTELWLRRATQRSVREARAELPRWIEQGVVTRRQAARMSDDEVLEMWRGLQLLNANSRPVQPAADVKSVRPRDESTGPATRADVLKLAIAIDRLASTIERLATAGSRRKTGS
jgi:hypothetical protein